MMSKRIYDKKLREEEEATAHVFQDFLTSFQSVTSTPSKVFIKSGVLNPDKPNISDSTEGRIYLPKPIIENKDVSLKTALECAKLLKDTKVLKNKNREKPLSNLELLKEEIKKRQSQKEDSSSSSTPSSNIDICDPSSTNLFIANLNPRISEEQLMLLFGQYGSLASVKIMWPRGEEKFRNFPNTNCGFVAFMSRKDAERALRNLNNRDDMRLSWGKSVELPQQPIYIPPEFTKLFLPPPYSGLPFNAQPPASFIIPQNDKELEALLSDCIVKVTIPLDKRMVCIIHRMVEFVIREGSLFEALIMMNETNNPDFAFLFDNKLHLHAYYRWKLYSILNGDGQKSWSLKPFRMVKNGPIWIPPLPIDYAAGMPDELFSDEKENQTNNMLSDAQCTRWMDLIKNLNLTRTKILAAMNFCLNHSKAFHDSISILLDSMTNTATHPVKKIARLFLLSDIFWNSRKLKSIKLNENEINSELKKVFENFQVTLTNLRSHLDRENFKTRTLTVLRRWSTVRMFSTDFIERLEELFLINETNEDEGFSSDEPLDGANLLKRTLIHNNDINIIPQSDNLFINSAWSRVDPEDLESQAMSTQKLYELEMSQNKKKRKKKKHKKKEYNVIVSSKWDDSDSENYS